MDICVNHAKMPRKEFITSFTEHEASSEWLDQHLNAGSKYSAALKEREKEVRKAQKILADIEARVWLDHQRTKGY